MANTIQEQLDATGFAKVLVVVQPAALATPPAGAGLAAGGAATRRSISTTGAALAAGMDRYFTVNPFGQEVALAAAALRKPRAAADGRVRRGGARLATRAGATPPPLPQVPKVRVYPYLGVMLGTVDAEGLGQLRGDARVQAVHSAPPVSLIRPIRTAASSRTTGVTWGLQQLGIPRLWAHKYTGKGVLVGHLDTGVDGAHPALKGAIAHFAEFDRQGDEVRGAKPRDSDEHGTHTAGTILGRQVGSSRFGVAPDAKLVSAMVIEGGDVIARILGGMNWALSLDVRILSMSLGLRGYTDSFLVLTQLLRARNVLPVFAVGNEYAGTSRSPGNYAEALSVGACDRNQAVVDFSGSMRFQRTSDPIVPDLVAPGREVLSCIPGGRYAEMSGTSMATPHVAGLAAILMQAKPDAMANEIEKAIFDSCSLPPGMLPERGNRGIPSGPRAFELLTGRTLTEIVGNKKKGGGKGGRRKASKGGRASKQPKTARRRARAATRAARG